VTPARGPMREFRVTYLNRSTETIWAHQVSFPGSGLDRRQYVRFMGEVDGVWRLILNIAQDETHRITEVLPGRKRRRLREKFWRRELVSLTSLSYWNPH
jgi:hypothetical protein